VTEWKIVFRDPFPDNLDAIVIVGIRAGYTTREIAEMTGLSEHGVSRRRKKALEYGYVSRV